MFPHSLELIINAITGISNPIIKDKFQRNETVIKLLKQFNLAPEHPPADFSGVYAYALVEYGVGKPKQFLELFRQEQIKQAFRKALDHNNPSILLSEVDTFLDAFALGDEIKALGLDIRREVAAFATLFIEVAKRSRTPADALMSQQIGSLHRRVASITEQLERLPTLEGIRTEMARLASQNYPALPDADTATKNNCRAVALAQQMRGWFETLGYVFEKHEVWAEGYFEWIINIQGRRGYDRILVRGVEGEAGVKDVTALGKCVEQHKTDEGWLLSARRISKAARDEVKKDNCSHIFCYTFDELLDQDADFNEYLNWLEAEVKRRGVDKKYVPLACTKEELDPVTKHQIAVSHYDEEDGWIDGYIDQWLHDPVKEHISILGEFGTGKTWFALHYAWVTLQRYRDAQKRGVERPRLPLVIPLRDYAKAVSVESLFSEFFFRKHKMRRLHYPAFEQLNRMGKLLLIFDGFDEMAARVDRQEMINNFWELAKVVVPGSKVILTCRTEHFPEAKEGRAVLNAELQASTANLTGETPQFEVLELEKFNDDQIRLVLSFQASSTTVESVMGNPQLLDLARRPVMTELILEALPDIEAGLPVDISRVYLYAVRHKMERDIKAERTFTSLADKLYFLCELSWEMLSCDQMSLNYRLFPNRIRRLFGSVVQEEKDLDHWHYDMMAQTMLIRNADGDYTPAHRSLLEFFVAYKLAAELGVLALDFTELARSQSHINNNDVPQDCTWSFYFRRNVDLVGNIVPIAPLKGFVSESLENLRKTFGRSPLTKAVMDLLLPMLGHYQSIIHTIEATRGKTEDEVGYVGGNAATLVVKIDKAALEGTNLSGAVIRGADFCGASLRRVNFAQANLTNSIFTQFLSTVLSLAFSPDGQMLATGDANSEVCLRLVSNGEKVLTLKGHTDWVWSVPFSPNGQILASCSETIKLWDVHTGQCLNTLRGSASLIWSAAFSPDGQKLVSASDDGSIQFWDVYTGECLRSFSGHIGKARTIAFSPDGLTIASGGDDQIVKLWDFSTGQCLSTLPGHNQQLRSVAFSPDGRTLASGSEDYNIRVWDVNTGQCLHILHGHTNRAWSVAFSSDGHSIASGSEDRTVRVWNISDGRCLAILQGHPDWIRAVAFSPDGRTIASGGDSSTVKLWDISTGQCLNTMQGYTNGIWSVAFSPDGQTLASGSEDETIRIWDFHTGQCLKMLRGHVGRLLSIAFSPDGFTLASSGDDETGRLWDVSNGQCLTVLRGHRSRVRSVAFSPNGLTLATSSEDQTVKLWNVSDGKCINTLVTCTSWLWSVAFSPDGQILATAGAEKMVKLWDVCSGECISTLQGPTDCVGLIAFSPDGRILASGSHDNTIRLSNVSTGQCLGILNGHTALVWSVAFSPDGQMLASSSHDHTVRLWNVSNHQCIRTLQGHNNRIRSVAFSLNSQVLVSGSDDGTIKFWNVKTGEYLKTLRPDRPYERMNITGVVGLTEVVKATLKALGAVESE